MGFINMHITGGAPSCGTWCFNKKSLKFQCLSCNIQPFNDVQFLKMIVSCNYPWYHPKFIIYHQSSQSLKFTIIYFPSMALSQWPFQDPRLEVPTIYKAYISGLNFREYPHKIWPFFGPRRGPPWCEAREPSALWWRAAAEAGRLRMVRRLVAVHAPHLLRHAGLCGAGNGRPVTANRELERLNLWTKYQYICI